VRHAQFLSALSFQSCHALSPAVEPARSVLSSSRPARRCALSARLALILIVSSVPPVSVVRHRVACVALYKSPYCVVVVPCVIKKSQESDEDEASKRGVHQVRDKSSDILRDSSSIRQNYSIEEKIFSNWLPKKEDPWMTSTGTRSRACDYCVELVRVSKFVIRISGLMDGLTR
jgi:hypothetical protein